MKNNALSVMSESVIQSATAKKPPFFADLIESTVRLMLPITDPDTPKEKNDDGTHQLVGKKFSFGNAPKTLLHPSYKNWPKLSLGKCGLFVV